MYKNPLEDVFSDDSVFDCWDSEGFHPENFSRARELLILFAAAYAQSDICNGGFHQFFGNHTGRLAPEAVAGWELLGFTAAAAEVTQAMKFFGEPYPRDDDRRNEMLEAVPGFPRADRSVWDPFTDNDTAFYAAFDSDKFDAAVEEYRKRTGI
jgi:hypothetical protein